MLKVTADDWDRQFAVNARGVFLCYKYGAKHMIAQGRGGRIIGASSVAGKQGECQELHASRLESTILFEEQDVLYWLHTVPPNSLSEV